MMRSDARLRNWAILQNWCPKIFQKMLKIPPRVSKGGESDFEVRFALSVIRIEFLIHAKKYNLLFWAKIVSDRCGNVIKTAFNLNLDDLSYLYIFLFFLYNKNMLTITFLHFYNKLFTEINKKKYCNWF